MKGDKWWFIIGFGKLPGFREPVKPRLVGGDRSHGATFFTKPLLKNQEKFLVPPIFSTNQDPAYVLQ